MVLKSGKIAQEGIDRLVDIEIWGENQRGETTTKGTATVWLPFKQVGG